MANAALRASQRGLGLALLGPPAMAGIMRTAVSKKKVRFVDKPNNIDLDLTFIVDARAADSSKPYSIIAMGFPSSGLEAQYRNPLPQVQKFFEIYSRPGDYCVYNLCSERDYASMDVFSRIESTVRWDDHNPPPLALIEPFCAHCEQFAEHDAQSAIERSPTTALIGAPEVGKSMLAIHCKAGKGRTGCIIACLLCHLGICDTPEAALVMFADARTRNSKGVTIPSQIRYVYYYAWLLRESARLAWPIGRILAEDERFTQQFQLLHVRLVTTPTPNNNSGGCDPYFKIFSQRAKDGGKDPPVGFHKEFDLKKLRGGRVAKARRGGAFVDLHCSHHNIFLRGAYDYNIFFFDRSSVGKDEKLCGLWFNTGFIERSFLRFEKRNIDKACKDKGGKTFEADFAVELFFRRVNSHGEPSTGSGGGGGAAAEDGVW